MSTVPATNMSARVATLGTVVTSRTSAAAIMVKPRLRYRSLHCSGPVYSTGVIPRRDKPAIRDAFAKKILILLVSPPTAPSRYVALPFRV